MERLSRRDVHEATEVLVQSFDADPVYMHCFPNSLLRRTFVYSVFAAQIHFLHLRTSRVLKDSAGKIVGTVVFEDERLNVALKLLGFIAQSLGLYFFMIKYLLLAGLRRPVYLLAAPILFPLIFVAYHLCMFYFGFNLMRAYCASAAYARKDKWHKQKKKHLLAIGCLPSEQGKGYGSMLLKSAFAELEAEKYYGGYALESSNPRNVKFYERNQFVVLGVANINGMTITLMVRPDLHRPVPKEASEMVGAPA
mmetsp:Transcript_27404/g.58002  ORF Transcript_27404/g.58002 Transcript_27404/m.58002 type:complete len:252 (+) Transcript_27404:115-870(+)